MSQTLPPERRGTMPPSIALPGMIMMPVVCGRHVIYYPDALRAQAQKGVCAVFQTECECGTAYIITTQPDSAHLLLGGAPQKISALYEGLTGEESIINDPHGDFFFKTAPLLTLLKSEIAALRAGDSAQ